MKKIFQNKYVIAGAIIVAALGIAYAGTWGNKNWLLDRLADREEVTEEMLKTYATKTAGELRSILKAKKA